MRARSRDSAETERATLMVTSLGSTSSRDEPMRLKLSRPTLLASLESSSVGVQRGSDRFVVDRTTLLVVPRGAVQVHGSRSGSRFAAIGFGDVLLEATSRRYKPLGFDRARLDGWLARAALLPRTVWVHEIVHRYAFERQALGQHDNLATRFLEIEIVKELFFLFRDRDEGADRASIAQRYSPPVERAVAFIEGHLFDPCTVGELARRVGASESTLLRSFRRELGCRPGEYWRTRRLEEAMVLLRAGTFSVAEIAARVGYLNPTSFGLAFRQHFGRPPSAYRRARPTKRAP